MKNLLLLTLVLFLSSHTKEIKKHTIIYEKSTDIEERHQNELLAESLEQKGKLKISDPSPKFNNYENNKGGTTSLYDLKGKYVYIDVWATWRGYCTGVLPNLKKIQRQKHRVCLYFY